MALVMLLVIVVFVLACGLLLAVTYNGLVRKRNATDSAWAQVDVQLKRRYDLIPNLVETVKGYASHERQTLEAVTAARSGAFAARGPAERAQAEGALTSALNGLFAVAEAYPALKADQNFHQLQEELGTTENRIAYARQYYNDAVLTYNNAIQTVPTSLVAAMTGFQGREYFRALGDERGPVQVRF